MAQLKDTVVTGGLRVTDTTYTTNLNLTSSTASQAVVTDASKNLVSREITNNTSATAVAASTNLITANTLYYHKGNSNIVTVGTVTSGTWNGTAIALKYGGTGADNTATAINKVFAGPSSGSAGNASFRALVAADLPTVTVAKGGLNKTSIAIYAMLYASAANTYAELAPNTTSTKKFLTMTGTGSAGATPGWNTIAAGDLPIATTSAVGGISVSTGLSVTAAGALSVSYGTAASTALQGNQTLFKLNNADKTASSAAAFYAPTSSGTSGYILTSGGSNTAPNWTQTLGVANGGTGANTFTSGNLLVGAGTNAITTIAKDSANTASTVVVRDASGNFSAGTITAALSGNASTATTLATARNLWGNSFDGSAAIDSHIYLGESQNIYMPYNSTDYPVIRNYNNGNVTMNACSGVLNVGYENTTSLNLLNSTIVITKSGTTPSYAVATPANFRSAIDVDESEILSTDSTAAGYGITVECYKRGWWVQIYLHGTTTSALTAEQQICTIATKYRPRITQWFVAANTDDKNINRCSIDINGKVKFNLAIAKSKIVCGTFCYIAATYN